MSIKDRFTALMDRKYALWGQNVRITHPTTGGKITLRLIDATTGVEVGDNMVAVATVEPAAMVRKAELTTARITASALVGVTLTLSGVSWRVQSTSPKPTVHGAEYGEVVLLLSRAS